MYRRNASRNPASVTAGRDRRSAHTASAGGALENQHPHLGMSPPFYRRGARRKTAPCHLPSKVLWNGTRNPQPIEPKGGDAMT